MIFVLVNVFLNSKYQHQPPSIGLVDGWSGSFFFPSDKTCHLKALGFNEWVAREIKD